MNPQDTKIAELEKRIRELEDKIAQQPDPGQSERHLGGLFKRDAFGKYVEGVFCPRCRYEAVRFNETTYICPPCRHMIDFRGKTLQEVINDLTRRR